MSIFLYYKVSDMAQDGVRLNRLLLFLDLYTIFQIELVDKSTFDFQSGPEEFGG